MALNLPGFRFRPRDHEVITQFLVPMLNGEPPELIQCDEVFIHHPKTLLVKFDIQGRDGLWLFTTEPQVNSSLQRILLTGAQRGYWSMVDNVEAVKKGNGVVGAKCRYRFVMEGHKQTAYIMDKFYLRVEDILAHEGSVAKLTAVLAVCRIKNKSRNQVVEVADDVEIVANDAPGQAVQANETVGFRFHPLDDEIIVEYLVGRLKNALPRGDPIKGGKVFVDPPEILRANSDVDKKDSIWMYSIDEKPATKRVQLTEGEGYWKQYGHFKDVQRGERVVGAKMRYRFYTEAGAQTRWEMVRFLLRKKDLEAHEGSHPWWTAFSLYKIKEKVSQVLNEDDDADPNEIEPANTLEAIQTLEAFLAATRLTKMSDAC